MDITMYKEKYKIGKALRDKTPRSIHARWQPDAIRPSVESMVSQSEYDRLPELIPIRHFRMSRSPFVFYRATASLMARDLASTAYSGINVQACGDCHLMNFGGFATPERTIIIDVNDFDETNPGPWEWDLKRLATSFVLACREKSFSRLDTNEITMALIDAYCQKIRKYAGMNFLDLWYTKFSLEELQRNSRSERTKAHIAKAITRASAQTHDTIFYKITANTLNKIEISDQPPLVYHPYNIEESMNEIISFMYQYKNTLQPDRRMLLEQYKVVDLALKVVGVGSVGTRCFVMLLMNDNNEPLFLQVKEASVSVLEHFTGRSEFQHAGERVVHGQRIIQAASDIFLGWATGPKGRFYYLRQLRDKKLTPNIDGFDKHLLAEYARLCGNILARAHCKTGLGPLICGYIGKCGIFTDAISKFATAYADQTEKDYDEFMKAIRAGKLAVSEEPLKKHRKVVIH